MTTDTDKYDQAAAILDEAQPAHRGAAFVLLKEAGLGRQGGKFFNIVVSSYEKRANTKLGHSPRRNRADHIEAAHNMSAEETLKHITTMGATPDDLFWACWGLHKDGKWDGEILPESFTTHFTREPVQIDVELEARCHDALDGGRYSGGLMDYTSAYELMVDIDPNMKPEVIKGVIAEWLENNKGHELPRSPDSQLKHEMRVRSHKMSAEGVKAHIASCEGEADQLTWQTWKLFKEGKWRGELTKDDFASVIGQEKKSAIENGVNEIKQRQKERQAEPAGVGM